MVFVYIGVFQELAECNVVIGYYRNAFACEFVVFGCGSASCEYVRFCEGFGII